MKICILSLYKSENLGEMAYTDCLSQMIKERIPNADIELIDIHGRDSHRPYKDNIAIKILRKLHISAREKKLRIANENTYLKNYYTFRVKGAKAFVIPGGVYQKYA